MGDYREILILSDRCTDINMKCKDLNKRVEWAGDCIEVLIEENGSHNRNIKNIYDEITLLKSLHLKNQKIIVSGICWLMLMTLILKYI